MNQDEFSKIVGYYKIKVGKMRECTVKKLEDLKSIEIKKIKDLDGFERLDEINIMGALGLDYAIRKKEAVYIGTVNEVLKYISNKQGLNFEHF